ncbi:MAG: type II secretion system F family protein [Trebonia sp.]
MSASSATALLAIVIGGLTGGALFLTAAALYGLPAKRPGSPQSRLHRLRRDFFSMRGGIAIVIGILILLATRWVVAGVGVGLLAYNWRSVSGATSERAAIARLEGLATWTESLRDTIAGAVGLEQAIPSSTRIAAPAIREPLLKMVDRLHTRMPMPDALRLFATDLDDPSADLIIAALIINSRLRGPGLRDLLGALSASVREELDMRRKVSAERRSTRRSVQIVIVVSVGMAVLLALVDHAFLAPYGSPFGQLVLALIAVLYGLGIAWLRRLAKFESPQRLLGAHPASAATAAGTAAPASAAAGVGAAGGNVAGAGAMGGRA